MPTITKLKNSKDFVKVTSAGKTYYGGDQAWFDRPVDRNGACGTVAAANILAYMWLSAGGGAAASGAGVMSGGTAEGGSMAAPVRADASVSTDAEGGTSTAGNRATSGVTAKEGDIDTESVVAAESGCSKPECVTDEASEHLSNPLATLYPHASFEKSAFTEHMNDVIKFLSPLRIPFTQIPLGIWPLSRFERGVKRFAKSHGVVLSAVKMKKSFTKANVTTFIRGALERDHPVAMLIGFNQAMDGTTVTLPDGSRRTQSNFKTHWVTITELAEDEATGTAKVRVSTWGGEAVLDIDAYISGEQLYACLTYFAAKERAKGAQRVRIPCHRNKR